MCASKLDLPNVFRGIDFAVHINGNNLAPFLQDGDIAFIKSGTTFSDGEFVCVHLAGCTTLKTAYHSGGGVVLDGFSCDVPPMVFSKEQCKAGEIALLGTLSGFVRPAP